MIQSYTLFNVPGCGPFTVPILGAPPWETGAGGCAMRRSKRLKAKRAKQMRKLRRKQGRI